MNVSKNTKIIHIPIIQAAFALVDTEKKFDTLLLNNPEISMDGWEWGTFHGMVLSQPSSEGMHFIMFLNDKEDSTIVHESTHMAHYVMAYKGMPLSRKNTEIQAYLIQYIYEQVKEKVKR